MGVEWAVTYPKELREITSLEEKTYPFQLFINSCPNAKINQNILYMHWHEHFEIIMMIDGSAIFHIDSQPYEVNPGEVLIVPAGGLHVGYSLIEGDLQYMSIVFNGSLFNDWVHDPVHAKFVAPYVEGRLQYPVKLDMQGDRAVHYSLLEQIVQEYKTKNPAYQLITKSYLHLLFTLLARDCLPQQLANKPKEHYSMNRERFKPLLKHLENNYADKISIEQAAKHVNLNPYHFCKMFKKLTGRTFVEYVNVFRINEAERLLMQSDLTVTEIAGKVGCDNPNYFTKLFKQYKGMTPSQLRHIKL